MMTKPSLSELFFAYATDFLTVYLTEKLSRSSKTAESYRDALTIFRRYINSELQISLLKFKIEDITVDLILDYRDYLQKNMQLLRLTSASLQLRLISNTLLNVIQNT